MYTCLAVSLDVQYTCIIVAKQAAQGDNEHCPYHRDRWGSLCWLVWWSGLPPSATRVRFEVLVTNMFNTRTSAGAGVGFQGKTTNCSSPLVHGHMFMSQMTLTCACDC